MAKKEIKTQIEKIEREYIIPLREKCRVVPRYKKTPKAIKTIKEFLVRHMKIYDGDLNKIKIDKYLNEYVWFRGIRKPPIKIKVKAIKEGDIVRVELVDYPDNLKFKKLREERIEGKGEEIAKKKKAEKKAEEEVKSAEAVEEEKEKKAAVVESGREFEKAAAKQTKHDTVASGKIKEITRQKHQVRKALQK